MPYENLNETEMGILGAIEKEMQKGTRNYQSLPPEFKHEIEHFASPHLTDAIAERLPDFDFTVAARYLKKHWIRLQCGFCQIWTEVNMTEGIPLACSSCKRRTKEFRWDAGKMATWLMDNYKFAYLMDIETLEVYDEERGVWIEYAEELIRKELYAIDHDNMTAHIANEAIASVKASCSVYKNIFTGAIRRNEDNVLFNLQNGIYSLKDKKLLPHDPSMYFMGQLPITYDPAAEPARIAKAFWEVSMTAPPEDDLTQPAIPHWDRYISLFEYAAWIFMPDNNFQKIALFWGEGSNGKDVVHHVYRALVGEDNSASVNMYQITKNRFAPAGLYNKLLNTAGEVAYDKPLEDTNTLKTLRGENPMTVELKGKPLFSMKWHGKCFFNANRFPKTTDDTTGFYRTWQIQKFENVFNEKRGNIDTHLKDKLTTENELSGLFNVIVNGFLPLLMTREGFTFSMTVQEIKNLYDRKSDSSKVYIDNRIVADPDGRIWKDELRNAYEAYTDKERLPLETDKSFRMTLNSSGLPFGEKQEGGRRYYQGIRFKTAEELKAEEQPTHESVPIEAEEFIRYYIGMQSEKLAITQVNEINKIILILRKYQGIVDLEGIAKKAVNPVKPVLIGSEENPVKPVNPVISGSEMTGNAIKPVKPVLITSDHTSTAAAGSSSHLPSGSTEASPNSDGAGSPQETSPPGQPTIKDAMDTILDILKKANGSAYLSSDTGKWDLLYNSMPSYPHEMLDTAMHRLQYQGDIHNPKGGMWKLVHYNDSGDTDVTME